MRGKLNIRPENCRFIVLEEKREVICLIENTDALFTDFADNNFDIPYDCMALFGNKKPSKRNFNKKLIMPKCFWGIATCAEDDEWDVEKGKLLAFSKAKDKLNQSFFKRANLYISTFDRSLNDAVLVLNNLGAKLTASSQYRHEKINKLIGVENGVSEN